MQDKAGRAWLKVSEVFAGMIIELDNGFDCAGGRKVVYSNRDGDNAFRDAALYFDCDHGRHYLDGQLDETNTFYVGIYRAEKESVG